MVFWRAMMTRATAAACLLLAAACAPAGGTPDVEHIPLAGDSRLPFSAAVRVGPMLYLSGQIGTDESGALVPGGIEPETRQTLENIKAVLERGGSSLDQVVKCTVMLADISEWPAMNAVYTTYFKGKLPARSAFAASGLAMGARIELECWAAVGR
ncbi:MAG TPA: RidA family protein [Candidatus Polarisedimenticolia bacterium]|nr:RidA family protein [Candidatus Polarisedimenticolia bacterium]